jgi:hypothetical protein
VEKFLTVCRNFGAEPMFHFHILSSAASSSFLSLNNVLLRSGGRLAFIGSSSALTNS